MSTMQEPSNSKPKHSYIRTRSAKKLRVGKMSETECVMGWSNILGANPDYLSLASQQLAI